MRWMIVCAGMLSTAAAAEPAYLACVLDQGSTELRVDITVDEATQAAIIALPSTGRLVSRKAIFSPSDVTIPDQPDTWRLDRTTLKIDRSATINGQHFTEGGQCSLKPTPAKRVF